MTISPGQIKKENTELLNEMGIQIIDWLPHLDKATFRSSKDIAKRAVILATLLQLHFEAPNDFIVSYLKSNGLINDLTPREKRLLSKKYCDWSKQDQIDLDWSMDAIWAMMWAGGKHQHLTLNTFIGDTLASMAPTFHKNESATEFVQTYELLPEKRIFTELDKFYRAHWYARNNPNDKKVHLSVIMERRKALEWICDNSLDWDDISLDT